MPSQPNPRPEPIVDRLFTIDPSVRLIGGRHTGTDRLVFPCPDEANFELVPLSARGTLWSYTVQRFRPKSPPYAGPDDFEPYAVGYVELPGEVIVETRIVCVPFDLLRIGMAMVATTEIFVSARTKAPCLIYAFTAEPGIDA